MTFTPAIIAPAPLSLSRLKSIKNTVIGNPAAKVELARDEVFVGTLVQCLNEPSSCDEVRIEAAHVISSIAYGVQTVLGTLLRCDAPRAFLYALARLHAAAGPPPPALLAALARGLRSIGVAIADAVGPDQWGLGPRPERPPQSPDADAEAALDYLFQTDSLDLYLPLLLTSSHPQAHTAPAACIAHLLAATLRTPAHRRAVADWLPPADRALPATPPTPTAAPKRGWETTTPSKRGWEKPQPGTAQPPHQGWVVRALVALLGGRDAKLQESALSALAALARDNPPVAAGLLVPIMLPAGGARGAPAPPPLHTILALAKGAGPPTSSAYAPTSSRASSSTPTARGAERDAVGVQIAGCLCATNIIRAAMLPATTTLHPLSAPSTSSSASALATTSTSTATLSTSASAAPHPAAISINTNLHANGGGGGPASAGPHGHASAYTTGNMADADTPARTVMNVLNRIIGAPVSSFSPSSATGGVGLGGGTAGGGRESAASVRARGRACFVLYYLVADNAALAFSAYERGCLAKLAGVVHAITPAPVKASSSSSSSSNNNTLYGMGGNTGSSGRNGNGAGGAGNIINGEGEAGWDEDESESVAGLREAALTAIAALSLFDNTIRRAVTDTHCLLPAIQMSLSHRHVGIRYAACQCVRALSRAVAVLRTNIVDSGLGMSVFTILKKADEDRRVTGAALAAVCNIVNEFSPLRPIYLDMGLMPRLVQLLGCGDAGLRLSALWAVKNVLRKTSGETKRDVMNHLGWARMAELLEDKDDGVQEQAFTVVRNLAENEQGIDMLFRELGAEVLLRTITAALAAPDDDVVLQATYVLANLSNGIPQQALLLAHAPLLAALRTALAERAPAIRRPAVSAICELARGDSRGRRALVDAGVVSTLRALCYSASHALPSSAMPSSPGGPGGRGGGAGRGRGALGLGMDDDRDVVDQARMALDWLEHGEGYR
ncbi:armadillo-type protein [Mycena rebaudengoi]|nr:armadillo-type protein [Mycena rebaudengoi]